MIKTVLLLGADGKLGPAVLSALVAADFKVTVLKRAGSKSKSSYPEGVKEARIPDDFPAYELSEILTGIDAVVITIPGSNTELQMRLAAAAVNAGVQHFIPADFGSCDSDSKYAQELVPLYVDKTTLRAYLTKLAEKNEKFTWTSLVCGHFFDWEPKFLHIDIPNKRVWYLDGGEARWSTSTLGQIGKATALVLKNHDKPELSNKMVYMQSFCVTQKMVKETCEKVTGSEWETEKVDSKDFTKKQKELMKKGGHEGAEATEEAVWVLGTLEADWEGKKGFVNGVLGLEEEDLEEVIRKMVHGA